MNIDPDAPTVCIAHGRFIPCRAKGGHGVTQDPFWAKSVRDFQTGTTPGLTWEKVFAQHCQEFNPRHVTSWMDQPE